MPSWLSITLLGCDRGPLLARVTWPHAQPRTDCRVRRRLSFGPSPRHFLANGPVAWVEEIMVAERARRNGVGQALMIELESWAESQGAAYVSLASRRAR